jgi:AcrR family transcriptional regulator
MCGAARIRKTRSRSRCRTSRRSQTSS